MPPRASTSPVAASLSTKAEYIAYATQEALKEGVSVQEVLGTISCESKWNPTAVSPTHDYGLVQIHKAAWGFSEKKMFDPKFSIDFLVHQFKEGNAGAWTCHQLLYS